MRVFLPGGDTGYFYPMGFSYALYLHKFVHSRTIQESILLGKDDIFKTIDFIHIIFRDCHCGISNSVIHAVTVNNVASVLFFRLSSATYALSDLSKYLEGKLS